MSYPVRVYGPILNQSLSQYWSVLQMCLTFCNTKVHRPLSLMCALWGYMKMPPWLNILSTGADVAGTQYMRLMKCC